MKRILFLLKERAYSLSLTSYGLINSANHIAYYLETKHHVCKVVQIRDSNCIDKEVSEFKPNIVVLEALWVTAHKLHELMELERYHHVKWVVRVHSDMGYLASESHGIKLINDYVELQHRNLTVSLNSQKFVVALSDALGHHLTYLPNVMTMHPHKKEHNHHEHEHEHNHIHIGCFGALRMLKNQCFQAVCAIMAANHLKKKLYFHVTPNLNVQDDPVLKNLRELFRDNGHELMVHNWMPNHTFQDLIKKMDIGMQLSFTESFNIVTADFINNNKLILVSDAIDWMPPSLRTSTTEYIEVVKKIVQTYERKDNAVYKGLQRKHLSEFNKEAEHVWDHFLHPHERFMGQL